MMRSKDWILLSRTALTILLCFLVVPIGLAQSEDEGNADLDKAFESKIDARSTRDLDSVVSLCESAIEKGLNNERTLQAKQLAASALYEHADQLSQRIFDSGGQDKRWRFLRNQALSRLKKAIEFQPEMGEAYVLSAKLNALPGGDRADALAMIEKAVELAGDDREQLSTALFYRATLALDENAQLGDLNQAIKNNPGNIEAVRVRAAYYLQKREPKKALPDLRAWMDSDAKNVKIKLNIVRQLMGAPKFDSELKNEALAILDEAIEVDPDNSAAFTMRAEVNVEGEKLDEAIKDASRAIKLDQKNIDALIVRARIYSVQEELDKALEDINQVLEIQPLQTQGLWMRGIILSQQQKFSEAIDDIKKLADSDPRNDFFQSQLAMLYNANDEPSKAVRIYNRTLAQFADGIWEGRSPGPKIAMMTARMEALRGRGDAQLSKGAHKDAIADYEAALKLADLIREVQEAEGVEEIMEPDDGVLNNLAWVLATSTFDELRDGQRAIMLATQAAEVTEFKQAHILSTLASGYAEAGDFDKAIEWVEKAIELNRIAGEKAIDKTRTDKQKLSLRKEYESYKEEKPWREFQDVENENKETKDKETKNKETEAKDAGSDSVDSKSDSKSDKEADKKTEDKKTADKKEADKKEADKDDDK
jgi:tetratricopeptide (TPR) repeat protein